MAIKRYDNQVSDRFPIVYITVKYNRNTVPTKRARKVEKRSFTPCLFDLKHKEEEEEEEERQNFQ
jgi:hypothetical protein